MEIRTAKNKRTSILLLIIFVTFSLLTSCGVKGPPLQPILKEIPPVENIRIYQKGGFLFVNISFPENYSDNTPLEVKKAKIYYNLYSTRKIIDLKKFLKEANSEEFILKEKNNLIFKKQVKDYPQNFKILVYYWDLQNKRSQPSRLFEFEIQEPPPSPKNLIAEVMENGIQLKWDFEKESKDIGYFVYLSNGKEFKRLNLEPINKKEFLFRDFIWDNEYRFKVSSILKSIYESDDSEEISVVPVDKFPPPPPKNLIAIPEEGFVALKWDGVDVPDLEKYNVYRKENEKAELLTLNGTKDTYFEDRKGERGKIYKYFVTAVDKRGNESKPSNLAEERFR